jgi:hypothetical protein
MRIAATQLTASSAFAFALLALAAQTSPLAAQERSHELRGVVRDTAGGPLAGVEVLLLSPRRNTVTDAQGRFRLVEVPGGERRLLIRRIGYLPVRPSARVPQAEGDTLRVTLLPAPQLLPALIVESERGGIRGVVGDSGYHALPGTLVELLGGRLADTTDAQGRFGFAELRPGHYVLRISRVGYVARLLSVDLGKKGQEYSIFLAEYRPGVSDWANSNAAAGALGDLAARLAMEPRRTRMTRAELERYGTASLCDIPRLRSLFRDQRGRPRRDPWVLIRGSDWIQNATLCEWSADELDLLEWGDDPCSDVSKSIAYRLGVDCGANPRRITSLNGRVPLQQPGWVSLWPRS